MASITQKTMELLDKLFNLKSDDNVILEEINGKIEKTRESIEAATKEQRENEVKKVDAEGKLSVFKNQQEAFQSAFEGLDDETFAALRDIGVVIEIGTMLKDIDEKAPEYISELKRTISSYQDSIDENSRAKKDLEDTLAGLEDDKAKSEEDRNKLISLLEQSLSTDELERESLTTSYVKKILALFDIFTEDEIKELSKLIIFPDEGLYEYQDSYEERKANGFPTKEGYIAEEPAEEVAPVEERKAEETDELTNGAYDEHQSTTELYQDARRQEEDLDATSFIDLNRLNAAREELAELNFRSGEEERDDYPAKEQTPIVPEIPLGFSEVPEPAETSVNKDSFKDYLSNIGLDLDRFVSENNMTLEEVIAVLNSVTPKTIEDNYELLRSINVSEEAIYRISNNHSFLADLDVAKKVTLLRAKNISELSIRELLTQENSGLRKDLSSFEECITAIEKAFGKLTDENISYLSYDMVNYLRNYTTLQSNGFELEEKELRNYFAVLLNSKNIAEDIEVLKSYLISIVKKNGKYALSVFWKNSNELMNTIDTLIEAGLESAIATNPEGLSRNVNEMLRRVKYCEEQGQPVYEEDGTVCDYIIDFDKFVRQFGNVRLPEQAVEQASNQELPRIIGNEDYVEILLNTLDNYYSSENPRPVEIEEEVSYAFEELKQQIVDKLSAVPNGKYTYQVNDVSISKNKFERNLVLLLNALAGSGQSPEGVERELLLVAALYDLRQDDETKERMVSECLGFNNEKVKGGMTK